MPKFIRIKNDLEQLSDSTLKLPQDFEIVEVNSPTVAVRLLSDDSIDGALFCPSRDTGVPDDPDVHSLQYLLRCSMILDDMPDGVALVNSDLKILQANKRLIEWFENQNLIGLSFYEAIGNPDIVGTEPSPLASAIAQRKSSVTTIEVNDRYFELKASPILDPSGTVQLLVLTLRDSTASTYQRQKLEALHRAGMELADLRPQEIFEMDVDCRIDLLKDNILHYTQDLLNYNYVEIRLIDEASGRLEPLISVGINSDRAKQPLFAEAKDNGVTGFVAATGKSYLCEDTANDPLYLDGLIGARSSLTVPLIYHDKVIGSFNVEHPEVNAFSESDLQFVEAFGRDIAQALNTLELLAAEKTNTAHASVEAIHGAVALPVDEILNDTVRVIESYIGHNPDVVKRLRSILKNARDIKQLIQKIGESMAPVDALPAGVQPENRAALKGRTILVIDADEQVRTSAHNLLERYGCLVETAHEGSEAILMVQNAEKDYDAVISDIRLPDLSGYELLLKLKEVMPNENPKLILMTGFGYDPGHSIVKARQAGLRQGAVLYKPFRLDQLLSIVEAIVSEAEEPGVA